MLLAARRPLAVMGVMAWAMVATAQVATTPLTFSGTTTVGATSLPAIVTLTAQNSGVLTTLVALTGGSPDLDFAVTPLTCAINAPLTAGETCTVAVTFAPRYAGIRQGAVIAEAGSQLLASAPLSGAGVGSLPVLVPGTINTVAGDGDWIYQRDGIPATQAPIFLPSGVAVDAGGNLFLCDSSNNRVRRVDGITGYISTVAGNGSPGAAGDSGPATAAELSNPSGIAIDGGGNLYIADTGNNSVRRVDAISGVITTFAGQTGVAGYSGDGGAATRALLSSPRGLALMPGGDLLITDSANNAIRLVNITTLQIATVAGTGVAGYNQDGIAANSAELNEPYGVAVRSDGAFAIADLENQRVRLVSPAGIISTAAGTGQRNAGTPTSEQLDGPADVAFDPAGDLFIADAGNNRVRFILASSGAIQTLAGSGSEQFTGDGGPANQAGIYGPYALFFDAGGNLWLADTFHNRVREITGAFLGIDYATIKVGNVSPPAVEMLYNQGNANLVLGLPVLSQAALDPATTTCNQAPMAPGTACSMGAEFAPEQVGADIIGTITWPSNAPNVTPVDSLSGQVLSVNVTSVALASSQNPGTLGHAITLTATVTSPDSGRTGTVTFSEGGTTWCAAVTLNGSGTASCSIPSLSLGSHILTAAYSGDANNAASTSPALTEVVKQQPALSLTVSSNPAVVSTNVALTLTTVDQSGTATGSVVFYDGATALGAAALNSSGVAQWSTSGFTVGTHSLSAQYAGDSANAGGSSNTVSESITQASTLTTLSTSNANAAVGTSLTFTATVTNSAGPTLSGSVTFYDGTTMLGSVALTALDTSALTLSNLAPGVHSILATYTGNTDDAASSSFVVTQTITQIATVSTLGTDANPLHAGATLHVTASVALAPGETADGALTGAVTFRDGATVLGSVNLDPAGQAVLALTALAVGPHSLTASFAGSANYAPSSSSAVNQTVQQTATQTALSLAAATTLMGEPAGFSVVVSSATGIPTGQVSLRDGASVLATVTLSASATASFSITTLAQGSHSMSVAYAGDSNYAASVSPIQQQVVELAQPALTLSGPANAVDAGTVTDFVAAWTKPGIAPTGTMSLLDGGVAIASGSANGVSSLSFAISSLSIGTHTLTASYSGDLNNSGGSSAGITVVVRQAGSATAMVASANPVVQGGPLTLTATVTSDSPGVSGQIRFFDGAAVLGTADVHGNGIATFSPPGLGLGTHALTAVYSGDTNHATSTSPPTTEVVLQDTAATLTSSNNPAVSGQIITLTAQLSGASHGAPSGAASLFDNGTPLATAPLNGSGAAVFTTNGLLPGQHTITLSYAGDANFSAASAQLAQTVVEATTHITLTASANPATFAQPLTLAATVSSNGGAATGSITFTDSGTHIGTAPLNPAGVAVLILSSLSAGQHTLTANFAGDGKAGPSASSALSMSVKQTTALALGTSINPGWTLTPLTLTAALTANGAVAATGIVTFSDGATEVGTAALDATGHASLTLPVLSSGAHRFASSYAGDAANFAGSSAVYNEPVQLLPTATTVTGSAAGSSSPQQMILIAVVTGQGSPAPSGTVTFSNGSTVLGEAPIGLSGVATLTVVFSQATEPITVSYGGDQNYSPSQYTSSINAPSAVAAGAPFSLWVNNPSLTLVTHQHTTIVVNVASAKGFTDTIALGCEGLPSAGTCTFTPSQIKLAANGTSLASLVVDTGDPLGAGAATGNASLASRHTTFLAWLPLSLLAGLLRGKRGGRTRSKLGICLMLAIAITPALTVSGCGGLSTHGTAPGTYTFKVVGTGQASGISQTQTITLVVTQ